MRLYEFLAICNDNTALIKFLIAKGKDEVDCPIYKLKVKTHAKFY